MTTLNVLLVEDEAGIRNGLASFLQLKGHRVSAAASCADGLAELTTGDFDVVVTDWNLGDDTGDKILAACNCPVLVMSGVPEQIRHDAGDADWGERVRITHKPVLPEELALTIVEMCGGDSLAATEAPGPEEQLASLPCDVRQRLELVIACCEHAADVEILDDGTFVHVQAPVDTDKVETCLELTFGDFRVLERAGRPWLELRCFRDGRWAADLRVLRPGDAWPAPPAQIAIDFDGASCTPPRFLELVAESARFRARGGSVDFLNVPGSLRLWAEVSGKAHDMPKRRSVGPRLPEVLSELWR